MNKYKNLEAKLEGFVSKYYKNQLLRGLLFFIAIGVSYFLLVLLIEYFLWLRPAGRAFLFWSFVVIEVLLLYRFIGIPLARLFKLTRGIDFSEASRMIGTHFPEVSDKLFNTLQLKSQAGDSELVMASIAQKEKELEPVPFSMAIDYKSNMKYLKFAIVPILLFIIINFTGDKGIFNTSYERMINYDKAYAPPAPFSFLLNSGDLSTIENKDYDINVQTVGNEVPQQVQVIIDGNAFYMNNEGTGNFSYKIEQPDTPVVFYLVANGIRSQDYKLEIIKAPLIVDFKMKLDYPTYTLKRDETVSNTGSLTVPEGTRITWQLETKNTNQVIWKNIDSSYIFVDEGDNFFYLDKILKRTTPYSISSSNDKLNNYENLDYSIEVVRDAFPKIDVSTKRDSINGLQQYHQGNVSDDYGLKSLRLVYYTQDNEKEKMYRKLPLKQGNVDQFIAAFPDTLNLVDGVGYAYYFEITDNDEVNSFKRSRSNVFTFKKRTEEEVEDDQLERQQETIKSIDESLKKKRETDDELKKIVQSQKEKQSLNYSEQQQLKNFISRQRQQDQVMKNYAEKLKENLKNFRQDNKEFEDMGKELQERLEANERKLEGQEEMLKELEELREKLSNEELNDKLEQVAKQNKNSEKSLKQLLELTKKYYVEQKMKRIAEKIGDLAEKQKDLSQKDDNSSQKQQDLNDEFKQLEDQIEQLERENADLVKPIDLPKEEDLKSEIEKEQEEAKQELEKQESEESDDPSEDNKRKSEKSKASQKQQKASEKMKELAQKMESQMSQAGSETLQEDVEMLRQVLDNLILFSFNQEDLMKIFKQMDDNNPVFASKLVEQNSLRQNFEHIDDSLFALSLRVPQLGEKISEELTNVDYNIDQALSRLSENQIMQGAASQQYVVAGANTLADMLSSILNNMQQQLSGSGSGKGGKPKPGAGQSGDQLSDIIMSQDELSKKMGESMSPGKSGKKGEEGENGKEGKQGNSGDNGSGSGGSEGKSSESASDGLSEEQREIQYEIYKEQQQIRRQLEDLIKQEGLEGIGENLLNEMKNLEDRLLDGGLDQESQKRMDNLRHELLKLKKAEQEQGQEEKRESQYSLKDYKNSAQSIEKTAREYFNNKELLNREPLPLSGEYKVRVQKYFNKSDD